LNKKIYKDFLKLISFSDDEIEALLPDWFFVSKSIGLEEKDIKFAVNEWIPKYWDLSLQGVRLCMGAYIRELIDIIKIPEYQSKGVKTVYGMLPSPPICYRAIKLSGKENVYVGFPNLLISLILGAFFNKAAAFSRNDTYMSSSCRHCVFNRSRVNTRLDNIIPKPDAVWSCDFLCDEAPKTEELIRCITGQKWNYIISTMPHDGNSDEIEDENEARVHYMAQQIKYGHEQIERFTGIHIEKKDMVNAFTESTKYMRKLDKLTAMVAMSDPQPIGGNELTLFSISVSMSFNTGLVHLNKAIDTIIDEVEDRINKGMGILPKGSPKLGCHFIPFCEPWVDRAFLENGVCLSFSTFFASVKKNNKITTLDPYKIVSKLWLQNSQVVNMGYEAELVSKILLKYHPDGMLYGFFSFDRWLGTHQKMMLKIVEEKTNIQHFYIESEFWDDERYKLDDRIGRIENIAYLLKTKKILKNGSI